MAKEPHPADVATEAAIVGAAYFVVSLLVEHRHISHEVKSLAVAIEAGGLMEKMHETNRLSIVYAVMPDGRSHMIPRSLYPAPTTPMENDVMSITSVNSKTVQGRLPVPPPKGAGSNKPLSAGAIKKGELDQGKKAKAAERQAAALTPAQKKAAAVAGAQSAMPAVVAVLSADAKKKADADAGMRAVGLGQFVPPISDGSPLLVKPLPPGVTPAPEAGKVSTVVDLTKLAPNDPGPIPAGMVLSSEQRKAARDAVPPRTAAAPAAPTAMAVTAEQKAKLAEIEKANKSQGKTAAKPAKTTTKSGAPRRKPEDRARYDWAGASEKAAAGKMPPKLDFSAETHTRFRPALAEIEKMAKAGDVAGLKKWKWPGFVSSSPKAMIKYRDLCLLALKKG